MAQLIKLHDYISRYESDLSRYNSLFVRLKMRRWKAILEEESNRLGVTHLESEKVEELKQAYLDQLFSSQIKWASSTIKEKSNPLASLFTDSRLRCLVQRFPDTIFLNYNPVFQLKKAKVQMEVLMVTPSKLMCMSFLDGEEDALYIGSNGHFWQKKNKDKEMKVLSPVLSVRRMNHVARQIFQTTDTNLPIEKVVVAEKGYITHSNPPDDVLFIDKQDYETWLNELKTFISPMKMMQFRATKALLDRCAKIKVRRANGGALSETEGQFH